METTVDDLLEHEVWCFPVPLKGREESVILEVATAGVAEDGLAGTGMMPIVGMLTVAMSTSVETGTE